MADFNNHFARWFHQQPTLFLQRRLRPDQVERFSYLFMLLPLIKVPTSQRIQGLCREMRVVFLTTRKQR